MKPDETGTEPLLGKSVTELAALFPAEPPFRHRQLYRWLHNRGAGDFARMSDLALRFRRELESGYHITRLRVLQENRSRLDATRKFLIGLEDELSVEAVHMQFEERSTVCISTQVGCAINCPYCATGRMGLLRNLSVGEIVGQLHLLRHGLELPFTNVVLMGMGEPFHNYDAVMQALTIMCDAEGYGLSQRRLTVSTAGVAPRIRDFAVAPVKAKLAVSLSSPRDEVRDELVPLNRQYPLAELFAALEFYAARTRHRVTVEYVLLKGVNDTPADARFLRKRLGAIPAKLNLIVHNPATGDYPAATKEDFLPFYERFLDAPFPVTFRQNMGGDIDAACGQLWTRSNR